MTKSSNSTEENALAGSFGWQGRIIFAEVTANACEYLAG